MRGLRALTISAMVVLTAAAFSQQTFKQALSQMKIDQKLGAQVPANAQFKDETGRTIRFAELLGQRPIILLPMFFQCRGICGKEVDSVISLVAKMSAKKVGKDYDVVFLSINPRETPELALNKKSSLLRILSKDQDPSSFHFLTGKLDQIRLVTDAIGFGFAYDPTDGRINHPAGLMILTPAGRVSQYMFGSEYAQPIAENAIKLAANEQLGRKADVELLGCIMIDPITGKRSIVIENVIRLVAGASALLLFAWIGLMTFKHRRYPIYGPPRPDDGGKPTGA